MSVTDFEAEFGSKIRELRKALGLSQAKLAEKMTALGWTNYRQTTIARVEMGGRPTPLSEAIDLAAACGTDLASLLPSANPTAEALVVRVLRADAALLRAQIALLGDLFDQLRKASEMTS
jgi:transcriptional regulator with XRE-family HTH domain